MSKYPDEMTVFELRVAIEHVQDWFEHEARTAPCGDQDAAGDFLDDLQNELKSRQGTHEHEEFLRSFEEVPF